MSISVVIRICIFDKGLKLNCSGKATVVLRIRYKEIGCWMLVGTNVIFLKSVFENKCRMFSLLLNPLGQISLLTVDVVGAKVGPHLLQWK